MKTTIFTSISKTSIEVFPSIYIWWKEKRNYPHWEEHAGIAFGWLIFNLEIRFRNHE